MPLARLLSLCIGFCVSACIPAAVAQKPIIAFTDQTGLSLAFTANDVIGVSTFTDQSGQTQVLVRLGERARAKFGSFTGARVGQRIGLIVCGAEVARPTLRSRIDGGALQFAAASSREAEQWASRLKTGNCRL